jgi:hypothetical protein
VSEMVWERELPPAKALVVWELSNCIE